MTKQKTVHKNGLVGHGANVTEARADLDRQIGLALVGTYLPSVVRWRGWMGFLYRTPTGWCSFLIAPDAPADFVENRIARGTCYAHDDRNVCLSSLLNHVAQNGWVPADGCGVPEVLRQADERTQFGFASWSRWQLAAQHAIHVLHLDEYQVHAWASSHAEEF